jgi:hypothetical protein
MTHPGDKIEEKLKKDGTFRRGLTLKLCIMFIKKIFKRKLVARVMVWSHSCKIKNEVYACVHVCSYIEKV